MNPDERLQIAKCNLFRGIAVSEMEKILSILQPRVFSYRPRSLIRSRGEPCGKLLVLLAGKVSGEFQDCGGRVLRVETISAPETVASAFLFAPEPVFPVNIIALDEVRICSIDRNSLFSAAAISRRFTKALLEDVAARASFLAEKLRFTQFTTLRQKVAGYLLERLQGNATGRITLSFNQKVIAELFGVARPSLGRVLHDLEQSGLIAREHRTIIIRDRSALTELLTEIE